ncbi:MAG: hypothetical protein JXQ73_06995, partial [Phycisphaerae bacterium]|nr:hypothetical protein [Phycisphaerae bacterium]
LSGAYGQPTGRIRRGVRLLRRRCVLVQDEMHLDQSSRVAWQMHTQAKVSLKGRTAALRRSGQALTAVLVEPASATFEIRDANPPPPEAQLAGARKLIVSIDAPAGRTRVAVMLCPGSQAESPPLEPLDAWIREAQ